MKYPQTYPKHPKHPPYNALNFFFGKIRPRNTPNLPKTPQTPPSHHRTYNALNFFFGNLRPRNTQNHSKSPKHHQTITVHINAPKKILGRSPRPLRGGWGQVPPAPPLPVRNWLCAIIHTVIGLNDRQLFWKANTCVVTCSYRVFRSLITIGQAGGQTEY